jgi:hypothetical protein
MITGYDHEEAAQARFEAEVEAEWLADLDAKNEAHTAAVERPKPYTCHPDDDPPAPCPRRYALSECRAPDQAREIVRLQMVASVLVEALKLLVADVADYPAWQRPCHALDVARQALATALGEQQ